MPDTRAIKKISERFDVESTRYSNAIKATRKKLTRAAVVLTILLVAIIYAIEDEAAFQSKPVSAHHSGFARKCELCHESSFQLPKQILGVESARFEHACTECHEQHLSDHHVNARLKADCSTCHKEHSGNNSLVEVDDNYCVTCHLGLSESLASLESPKSVSFHNSIEAIESHPEIRIKQQLRPDEKNSLLESGENANIDPNGHFVDRTSLRFNHKVHMHSDGILVPPSHPKYSTSDNGRIQLSCKTCHISKSDHTGFEPISFEQSCVQCHELSFSQYLEESQKSLSEPIPHTTPELIRGLLRERLTNYYENNESNLSGTRPSRLPTKPQSRQGSTNRDKWMSEKLQAIEAQIFTSDQSSIESSASSSCQLCHKVSIERSESQGNPPLWSIEPPKIPEKWLQHARFDHARHQLMDCTDCHYTDDINDGRISAVDSTTSKHILLPSIKTCQECHKSKRHKKPAFRGRCVDCHNYHHALPERKDDTRLLELIQN